MQGENLAREAEIAELRDRLNREKAELADRLEKEKNEMKERLEKENQELKDKLANEKQFLQVKKRRIKLLYNNSSNQGNIDGNHNHANKRINELAEKLAGQLKNGNNAIKDLTDRFKRLQ